VNHVTSFPWLPKRETLESLACWAGHHLHGMAVCGVPCRTGADTPDLGGRRWEPQQVEKL
jgi:hypothetical protein